MKAMSRNVKAIMIVLKRVDVIQATDPEIKADPNTACGI